MKKNAVLLFLLLASGFLSSCMQKLVQINPKAASKQSEFEQVDFHQLIKRYMDKEHSSMGDVEGIYSVSVVIEKKSKPLFASQERERVVERKDNYATVAILRDRHSKREFMEISLEKEMQVSYPVRGEFTAMNDANIMIYKHFEPKGKSTTYTFSFDKDRDMLEGVRTEVNGKTEFTYTLTYLKLEPKQGNLNNGR
jgi:outer membrane lipoprotein-sorting protein